MSGERVWVMVDEGGRPNVWTVAPTRGDCIEGFNRDEWPGFYEHCRRKGWTRCVRATLTPEQPKSKRKKSR